MTFAASPAATCCWPTPPPTVPRIDWLERALRVTHTTGDNAEQAGILRRLTGELWDLGARPQATATLAALADLIGLDAATACCPPDMRARLPGLTYLVRRPYR